MKKTLLTMSLFLLGTATVIGQQNLGVNQTNPQAKTHITNTENQNSLQVDDEAGDASPFVIDADGNAQVGGKLTVDSMRVIQNASDGAVLTSDGNGNATWQPVLPAGVLMPFAGVTGVVPNGWLNCDGSEVSRTTYANLFTTIGTNYGAGDGTTTFNLPDMRGRFLRGADNGAGNDPDAGSRTELNTGGNTGDAVGSLQEDAFQGHRHIVQTRAYGTGAGAGHIYPDATPESSGDPISDGTNGTPRTGSETRPKNVSVNYIIKY